MVVDKPWYMYKHVPGEHRTRFPGPIPAPRLGPRLTGNGGFRMNTTRVERVTMIKPDKGARPYQVATPVPGNESRSNTSIMSP